MNEEKLSEDSLIEDSFEILCKIFGVGNHIFTVLIFVI